MRGDVKVLSIVAYYPSPCQHKLTKIFKIIINTSGKPTHYRALITRSLHGHIPCYRDRGRTDMAAGAWMIHENLQTYREPREYARRSGTPISHY